MHHTAQSPKQPTQRALSFVPKPTRPNNTAQRAVGQGRENNFRSPPKKPPNSPRIPKGVWTTHIEGRYRHFSIHQLTLYWSCYKSNLITYRQLRILFAASEMAERREYTSAPEHAKEQPRKPLYTLDELKHLVGGKGSSTADTALRADLKHLAKLGLLGFSKHTLDLATSIDQLRVDDTAFFWTMFNKLDHKRRPVPVPRRVVRAIAGHFNPGTTAVVLAALVRGMFWRKQVPDHVQTLFDTQASHESSGGGSGNKTVDGGVKTLGGFRIDNRTKREWIVEVFGISPRTVTNSRKTLIELGWLIPQDTPQWLTNRYGTHDAINPQWQLPKTQTPKQDPAETTNTHSGESASPQSQFPAKIASPDLNQNSSPTGNLKTRNPAPSRAGTAGVSLGSTWKRGSRKKKVGQAGEIRGVGATVRRAGQGEPQKSGGVPRTNPRRKIRKRSTVKPSTSPCIRNITSRDLADTGRLLTLHAQAVKIGLASPTESGRLDFLALAQRARIHGKRSGGGGALFFYLLREKKTGFITLAAEDEASRMLKAHLYGSQKRAKDQATPPQQWGGSRKKKDQSGFGASTVKSGRPEYSKDEQFVIACMRVAQRHRIGEPFRIAHAEGWTRDRWDTTLEHYEATKFAIRQSELMKEVED